MKQNNDNIDNLLYKYFKNHDYNTTPESFTNAIKNVNLKNRFFTKSNFILSKVAIILILFLTFTTANIVSANKITDFLGSLFNLKSINLDNSNILNSIDTDEYIQNITDKKINLNNEITLSINYLMIDSSNIYLLFNTESNKIQLKDFRLNICDLKLYTNNNEFYDIQSNTSNAEKYYLPGWKNINSNSKSTKELFFLYSNNIPNLDVLKINFSQVNLYNEKNQETININGNFSFSIPVSEKFKNQEIITYNIDSAEINNYYTSNIGTYCILKTQDKNPNYILKYNDETIESNSTLIFYDIDSQTYYYQLNFNFNTKKLKSNLETLILKDAKNNTSIDIKNSISF